MRQMYSIQLAIVTGFLIILVAGAFALIQSPEMLESPRMEAIVVAQEIPHPIQGHENCASCHGVKGVKPYPLKHLGWKNESCTKCHRNFDVEKE